jgi:hypothetical protein
MSSSRIETDCLCFKSWYDDAQSFHRFHLQCLFFSTQGSDDDRCMEDFLREQQCLAPLVVPDEWQRLAECMQRHASTFSSSSEAVESSSSISSSSSSSSSTPTITNEWIQSCGEQFQTMSLAYTRYWRQALSLPEKPSDMMERIRALESDVSESGGTSQAPYSALGSLRQSYWLALRKANTKEEGEQGRIPLPQVSDLLDSYGNMCRLFCYGDILCPTLLRQLEQCLVRTNSLNQCQQQWQAVKDIVGRAQIARVTFRGATWSSEMQRQQQERFEFLDPSTKRRLLRKLQHLKK